jgi:hypothetical protein
MHLENTPMFRRLLIPLLGSGLLLAASAGSALAKCEGPNPPEFCSEVVVGFGDTSASFQAGTPETVVFTVTQGEQPFDAMGVTLTFISQADDSRIVVPATATNSPGLWRAEVNLPDGGIWNTYAQVVTNTGAAYRLFVERASVTLPPAPPVQKPITAPPVTPTAPVLPIALVLGGLAAAALAGVVIRDRTRRRTAGAAGIAATSQVTADRT